MMMTAAATLESWKSLLLPRKEETLDTKEKLFYNRQLRRSLERKTTDLEKTIRFFYGNVSAISI